MHLCIEHVGGFAFYYAHTELNVEQADLTQTCSIQSMYDPDACQRGTLRKSCHACTQGSVLYP